MTYCSGSTGSTQSLRSAIPYDVHLLESDNSTRHHLVEDGQEAIYVMLCVDDLDDDWQFEREARDFRGVKSI